MARRLLPVFKRRRSSIIHSSYDISWLQRCYRFWDADEEASKGLLPLTEATFPLQNFTSWHHILETKFNEIQYLNLHFLECAKCLAEKPNKGLTSLFMVLVWSSLLYLFGLCKRHQDHLPNQKHKIQWASQPAGNYINIGETGRMFRTVEVYAKKWCSIRHAISPEVCLKESRAFMQVSRCRWEKTYRWFGAQNLFWEMHPLISQG